MLSKLSLKDVDVRDQKVLMRVDFNVPLDKEGHITDDTRIIASLPSIVYVLKQGGSVILMSHLGRPKGKPVREFSLAPCAKRLSELLKRDVIMAPDCVGPETTRLAKNLKPGEILLLENLRFHGSEEHPKEDPTFAQQLAQLGNVYINDAFGTAHREHSSTTTIAQYFPHKAAAGFLMAKEIEFLGKTLINPIRPFFAIIGGAKISSKIGVLKSLIKKADAIFIGGGMSYTFFKAQGINIGKSIHEDDHIETAKEILVYCQQNNIKFFLPQDVVTAEHFDNQANSKTISIEQGIPENFEGMDIGPKTIEQYSKELMRAKTVFWNGPLGVCEFPNFAKGTNAIAKLLAELPATTIVGGGDSIAAINQLGLAEKMTHLSTGGGASLEYIEFDTLPGIEALSSK
jgi:phosphoglycerate kinase